MKCMQYALVPGCTSTGFYKSSGLDASAPQHSACLPSAARHSAIPVGNARRNARCYGRVPRMACRQQPSRAENRRYVQYALYAIRPGSSLLRRLAIGPSRRRAIRERQGYRQPASPCSWNRVSARIARPWSSAEASPAQPMQPTMVLPIRIGTAPPHRT